METVLNSADLTTLTNDAASVGIVGTAGVLQDGSHYVLNIVGDVYENNVLQSGVWARLRVNGPSSLTFPPTTVQYSYYPSLGGWSSDGTTLSPSWIGDIGVIA